MSLAKKITLILLLVSLIPLTIISFLYFYNIKTFLTNSSVAKLEAAIELKAKRVQSFFSELEKDIQLIQTYDVVQSVLPDALYNKQLYNQLNVFRQAKKFDDILLLNTKGNIIYANNNKNKIGNLFPKSKDKILFKIIPKSITQKDQFYLLAVGPVIDTNKKLLGFIALQVDMNPLYTYIQDTTGLGKTGETFIGREEGEQALFISPTKTGKTREVIDKNNVFPLDKAITRTNGYGVGTDFRGKKVIAAWRYIPQLDSGLVVKIDESEEFTLMYRLKIITLIVGIITFLIVILATLFFIKSISEVSTPNTNKLNNPETI